MCLIFKVLQTYLTRLNVKKKILKQLCTVAHLSWGIWANHSKLLITMSNFEQMSEWANEQIPTLESSKKPPQKILSYEN